MAVETINPVAMVVREFKSSNLSFKQLGQRLDRDPGSVQVMFTKENMSVERLLACSKALNYNFFLEIGYKISYPGPSDPKGNPLTADVNRLSAEVNAKDLKITQLQTELQKEKSDADIKRQLLETELNTIKQFMKELFASWQV
jgi:FtsZ-binding cell division protein ZapB